MFGNRHTPLYFCCVGCLRLWIQCKRKGPGVQLSSVSPYFLMFFFFYSFPSWGWPHLMLGDKPTVSCLIIRCDWDEWLFPIAFTQHQLHHIKSRDKMWVVTGLQSASYFPLTPRASFTDFPVICGVVKDILRTPRRAPLCPSWRTAAAPPS